MSAGAATASRFTPSLMSHELLERLFVVRDQTLDAILSRVDAAATTSERNHTLLVGPRGAGAHPSLRRCIQIRRSTS